MAGTLLFGSPNPLYEGFVATRSRINVSNTSSFKQIMTRTAHVAAEALSSIKVCFQSFICNVTDSGVGSVGNLTATIEYPSGTIAGRLLFAGSSSGVAADPGVLFSDYLLVTIPAGATFWIRAFYTNATQIVYSAFQGTGLSEQCSVAASGLADQTGSTAAISGGTAQAWSFLPLAIIGSTRNPSVLIVGDSRTTGENDTEAATRDGKRGNVARSMGSVPFCNLSIPGETAFDFMKSVNNATRKQLLPYGSQVIVALGINDLAGRGVAQTIADIQAIWAGCGAQRRHCITVEPWTTGSWTTNPPANQTNASPLRVSFNNVVRAGIAGATGYYEVADVVESARDSTFWRVDAVSGQTAPYTADGLHHSPAGCAIIQSSGVIVPATYP